MMKKDGNIDVAGSKLNWQETEGLVSYLWRHHKIAAIKKRETGVFDLCFFALPNEILESYKTLKDAHETVIKVLVEKTSLVCDAINAMEQSAKEKEKHVYDPSKEYVLDPTTLTPEMDLRYATNISSRLRNILRFERVYTLRELSQMTRRNFLRCRNCGELTAKEIEELFEHVGLNWLPEQKIREPKESKLMFYSDQELLEECRRRGLLM